eukprot:10399408-Heterocapsa_arctica.AAC.1
MAAASECLLSARIMNQAEFLPCDLCQKDADIYLILLTVAAFQLNEFVKLNQIDPMSLSNCMIIRIDVLNVIAFVPDLSD